MPVTPSRHLSIMFTLGAAFTTIAACSGAGVKPPALQGDWQAVSINGRTAVQTLSFAETGRITGDAGCNRYSADMHSTSDGALRIGPVAATKRACLEGDRMRAESEFLAMLDRVRRYAYPTASRLQLLDADGHVLAEFARAAASAD